MIQEALDLMERSGERAYEAEVYREKGELLELSGKLSEDEACFRHATEVARRQQAKS